MSLVSRVGRRRPRARLAMVTLYLLLALGAVTTLYPFLLMVSTGMKGALDQNDTHLVPRYLVSDEALEAKYVADKYSGNSSWVASTRIGADASIDEVRTYREFLLRLPDHMWTAGFRTAPFQVTSRLTRDYRNWLRRKYRNDIDALNRAYIEENVGFQTVMPPVEMFERKAWEPRPGRKWSEWREFKRQLPVEFRIPIRTERLYQEYLRTRYRNRFSDLPASVRGGATRFEEVHLAVGLPAYQEFVHTVLPERYRGKSVESLWNEVMPERPMPIAAEEKDAVASRMGEIRWEFSTRNFEYVLDYILLNGRAVQNTAIFCLLAIFTQLVVNPLAAYALSRYPIRQSGKILLFLLATMAFPAEVAMIPSFLLLKDLGLLNTFAALVLPTAANGYMIFLLKGFFDSLPQELFEAGQMDGAKEITLMMRVALPLSKPVLGYLALMAFMGAYGAFLYAFLIAQDERMWTLMVFVYQLQNVAPRAVMMAALTLVALPTLLVFLFTQRVIMRGIVLPGER